MKAVWLAFGLIAASIVIVTFHDVLLVVFATVCFAAEPRTYVGGLLRLVAPSKRARVDETLHEAAGTIALFSAAGSQQFRERLAQPAQLDLVRGAVFGPQALRHTGHHEMHHAAVERGTRRGHLLDDGMTVRALVEHPLDPADLAPQSAQPRAQAAYLVLRQLQQLRLSCFRCHAPSIPPGVVLYILPGVC